MIYRFSVTTPASTPETSKIKTDIIIGRGVVHQIDILFPPGAAGLHHVQIQKGLNQLWPSNPDGSFAADGDKISFREHYELISNPLIFTVLTWNDDDTYAHEVIIRIGLLPRKFILRRLF